MAELSKEYPVVVMMAVALRVNSVKVEGLTVML